MDDGLTLEMLRLAHPNYDADSAWTVLERLGAGDLEGAQEACPALQLKCCGEDWLPILVEMIAIHFPDCSAHDAASSVVRAYATYCNCQRTADARQKQSPHAQNTILDFCYALAKSGYPGWGSETIRKYVRDYTRD